MPRSAAFSEFKDSLSIAQELLKIDAKNYGDPPQIHEQKPVQGLRGAAAVFVVAAFERYLKDAIEENLSRVIPISIAAFERLPDDIRINSTYRTLEYAMKGLPYTPKKNRKDRLLDIGAACQRVLQPAVDPAAFTHTGGNPGPETVNSMLADCDINDIFRSIHTSFIVKWQSPISHTFIRDKLEEIVHRRHVVAHTANALNITRPQLKESIRFLRILSELIDMELEKKSKALLIIATTP